MPVNTKHPQVEDVEPAWQTVEDCVNSRALKRKGETYLPKLGWKKDAKKKYEAYKRRALVKNPVKRTKQGIEGLVFRKPVDVKVPTGFQSRLTNVDDQGTPFEVFAKDVFSRVVVPGRVGILVDSPPEPKDPTAPRPRPFQRIYSAANIVNWDPAGQWVDLFETVEDPESADRFKPDLIEQYRVVELVGGGMQHTLWRKKEGGGKDVVWGPFGVPIVPLRNKKPLDFLPFVFINPSSLRADVEEPPLYDQAQIMLSIYLTSADLENGRHFAGLPTFYAFGVGEDTEIEVGSSTGLTSSNENAKAGYVEFTGQGLGALENAMAEKGEDAVAAGARLFERQKRAAESADRERLRQSGEWSVVASMADTTSRGLTKALRWQVWWETGADMAEVESKVSVELNDDYEQLIMTPDGALKWAQVQVMGQISKKIMRHQFRRGEVYPPGHTDEMEDAEIAEDGPQVGLPDDEDDLAPAG